MHNIVIKGGFPMNPQFKKGVLELVVLESVRKRDMYGYELVEERKKGEWVAMISWESCFPSRSISAISVS